MPISPDDPVTATFIGHSEPEFGFEGTLFQPVLHRGQEAGGVGTVDEPVIVGERQVDHGPHGDHLTQRRVLHHHGALHDRASAEDRHLRLIDDRCVEKGTTAAGVGERERATGQLVRADLPSPGPRRQVSPDELAGGTFTLTNTGSRGALFDTPIINQPQVAILGTGAVVKRAVVVEDPALGEVITVRSMVYLALTYDHRLVDGADAARFLATVKERLEEGAFEAELGL